ncbi:MAG: transketolase [Pirellulales bacterium]
MTTHVTGDKSVSTEQLAINTIRTLSMDAVQQANSGHPGTPMALAPVAYKLWSDVLRYDPSAPLWPVRDRFVLSCGHASMLLYAVLHLAGVQEVDEDGNGTGQPAVTLEHIRNFRQLGSPCAGHPEYGDAAGIEMTTGPLGQGIATSVGMAIAARWQAAYFGRPEFELFDYNVWALCSDGDLMEGVGQEAASMAGHLKLSNLCWIYDDNDITIEGGTSLAFSEDVAARFKGLGWHVAMVDDANDLAELDRAYRSFLNNNHSPTLIIVRSVIGFGSPHKSNSHAAHGAPLGEDEVKLTKSVYEWPEDGKFLVPDEVRACFAAGLGARGRRDREQWESRFAEYSQAHPELTAQWNSLQKRELTPGWDADIPVFAPDGKGLATRVTSGKVLNAVARSLPWLMGGSADLAPSTMTLLDGETDFSADDYAARNMHFGIREHGMAAACNGMALANLRPYGATFFVFTDYMRPSMRLSCIMRQPVIYVLTHDSIGLGEDGPTHQPIEHLAALRAMPRMLVMRPGDANEVAEAYRAILKINDRPACMVLTRQALPTLDRTKYGPAANVARGGYILADADGGTPQVILLATGSELPIALEACSQLSAQGIKARLVSMPCWELFDEQDETYREEVLPPGLTARVAVEAGVRLGWDKYIGQQGRFVGMSDFGASAPYSVLYEHFGITPEAVVAAAKAAVG